MLSFMQALLVETRVDLNWTTRMQPCLFKLSLPNALRKKLFAMNSICSSSNKQLISQVTETTDNDLHIFNMICALTDPNGRINVQNWRFLCLICGVVVPRNKIILGYLQTHLKRCSLDTVTEEGQFAHYCSQVCNQLARNCDIYKLILFRH